MKKSSLCCMFILFFSSCLLTHKEIKEDQLSETEEKDFVKEDKKKAKKESSEKKSQTGHLFLQGVDLLQKISQIETDMRVLRGQIETSDKKQKDRLAKLEQGLLALIQTLDLRLASLISEVRGQNKKAKKDDPEKLFKKAEDLFKEEKWKSAIISYEKYREQNKRGKFYKKATFQIGRAFKNLGMQKEAKVFFREVVESFPRSDMAKSAKKLLSLPD